MSHHEELQHDSLVEDPTGRVFKHLALDKVLPICFWDRFPSACPTHLLLALDLSQLVLGFFEI
jgi:hypothetical protein